MILVIDNFDSFTYNLVQYLGELGCELDVRRNNAITLDEITPDRYQAIVISPGPGTPAAAGVSIPLIKEFAGRIPLLGVCLGHQAMGEAFGGKVVRAPFPVHGKACVITHDGQGVFQGLPRQIEIGRYHSLVIEPSSMPACLKVTATTLDGIVMGVRHKEFLVEGVQFHPESVLTPDGKKMLRNFLEMAGVLKLGEASRATAQVE